VASLLLTALRGSLDSGKALLCQTRIREESQAQLAPITFFPQDSLVKPYNQNPQSANQTVVTSLK
jgi:hypothetical protein